MRSLLVHRSLYLPATDLTPERLDAYADALQRFRPLVLQGYPSSTDLLARHLTARGRHLSIPLVVLTAEPVLPDQRTRIAEALGARVRSFYGARECGWIAAEMKGCPRLHVNTAGVYVEADAEGRLLITDLCNWAMPLIRYEIGDLGLLDLAPCPCGDPRPVLDRLEGRLTDVIVLPSGGSVPGNLVDQRNYRIGLGLLEVQVVQDEPGHVVVRYVRAPGFRPESLDAVRTRLDDLFGGQIAITFASCERIEPDANGKVRYCISHVALPDAAESSAQVDGRVET